MFRRPPPRERCFTSLRTILYRWAPPLDVDVDEAGHYSLITRVRKKTGTPVRFGSVQILKTYVSFKFTPLHINPALGDAFSEALQERRQGKYSFNFNVPDEALFNELKALVHAGYQDFVVRGFIGAPEDAG